MGAGALLLCEGLFLIGLVGCPRFLSLFLAKFGSLKGMATPFHDNLTLGAHPCVKASYPFHTSACHSLSLYRGISRKEQPLAAYHSCAATESK